MIFDIFINVHEFGFVSAELSCIAFLLQVFCKCSSSTSSMEPRSDLPGISIRDLDLKTKFCHLAEKNLLLVLLITEYPLSSLKSTLSSFCYPKQVNQILNPSSSYCYESGPAESNSFRFNGSGVNHSLWNLYCSIVHIYNDYLYDITAKFASNKELTWTKHVVLEAIMQLGLDIGSINWQSRWVSLGVHL